MVNSELGYWETWFSRLENILIKVFVTIFHNKGLSV